NKQRAIIYDERQKVLEGADTRQNILDYTRELIETGVEAHCEGRHSENWDIDGLLTYLRTYFPVAEGDTIPDEVLHKGRPAVVEPGGHRLADVPFAVRAGGPAAAVTDAGRHPWAERPRSQRERGRRAGRTRRRGRAGLL